MHIIQRAGRVNRRELESLLGVGSTRAVVLLKRLVKLDKVQKIGNGKITNTNASDLENSCACAPRRRCGMF